jgi:hypothetical protein
MQKLFLSLIVMLALGLAGCAYVNVDDVPGTPSPDGKYSLHVAVADRGHPLFDKSKKSVKVCIGILSATDPKNQDQFFDYSYTFKGTDIQRTTHWISSKEVSVELYNTNNISVSNHIAALSFAFDDSKHKFVVQK